MQINAASVMIFRCRKFNAEREAPIGIVEPEHLVDFILSNPPTWTTLSYNGDQGIEIEMVQGLFFK